MRKKTFAHPYLDHTFEPLRKSAKTTAISLKEGHPDTFKPFWRNLCPQTMVIHLYGDGTDTDEAAELGLRDLEGNNTTKDSSMTREGVSEASADTLAVASDMRCCGFCQKCLVGSWFECQDCTDDANFCQPCSFLYFPQHVLKAVSTHGDNTQGAEKGSAQPDDTAGVDVEPAVEYQDDVVDFELIGRDASEDHVSVEQNNSFDAELSEDITSSEPGGARDTELSEDVSGAETETDDEAESSEDIAGAETDIGGETESSDVKNISDIEGTSSYEGALESQASRPQRGRQPGKHRRQPRGERHMALVDTLLDVRRRLGTAMDEISAAVKLLQKIPVNTADSAKLSSNLLDLNASLAMYSLPSLPSLGPRRNAQTAHARWSPRGRHQLS